MGTEEYWRAYKAAAQELESLLQQQERAEKRILALRQTINTLSTLIQETAEDEAELRALAKVEQIVQGTLTDDIFRIISTASEPLTTTEIREELNKLGGSMAELANPLATINAVASRLDEQGRVKETVKGDRKAWRGLRGAEKIAAGSRRYGATFSLANTVLRPPPPPGKNPPGTTRRTPPPPPPSSVMDLLPIRHRKKRDESK